MALARCRECGGEVSIEAVSCPRCGVPAPTSEGPPQTKTFSTPRSPFQKAPPPPVQKPEHQIPPTIRRSPDMKKKLLLWGCGAFAGLVAIGVVADLVTPRDPRGVKTGPPATVRDWWIGPYVDCQEQIKARLKAPSTASFVTIPEVRYNPGGSEAYILGHVDAQNSFGAMLRQRFGCHLVKNASGWTVEGVAME